jgi:uncharacterized protein (DUF58 family)
MRAALRTLTVRGRCVFAAGIASALSGLALQERDLLRVAALLISLPLVAASLAARTRFRLKFARRLDPARVSAGERAQVVLRLENISRLPTGLLLIEESVPYLLGGRPRLVLDRLRPNRPVDVTYPVSAEVRGRYSIGPLTVRLMDPFGLCELPRSFTSVDTLVVTPAVVPLPAVRLTGEWAGSGLSTARSVASAGEDDTATREYRHGDDLRRIHWRTTARRGELAVRREEQPWQSRGAVILDTRTMAHRGDGAASSFEWAVSAAASIAVHLSRSGFTLRLVTDTGRELSTAGHSNAGFSQAIVDELAVVEPSYGTSLAVATAAIRRQGGEGLIVAILGALDLPDAEQLTRLRSSSSTVGVALLLDPESWSTSTPTDDVAEDEKPGAARDLLAASGWRVLEVRRGDLLTDLWSEVGMRVAATASRTSVGATTGASLAAAPGGDRR